ncbi:MAG: GMC family oxidoreductase [Bacillota bacterium]
MTNKEHESIIKEAKEADFCIVGAGPAGSILAKELSEAGYLVVVLEAGPLMDPQSEWVSDELEMNKQLAWTDLRLIEGKDPIKMGHNNSGRGVGGGTNHFSAVSLRFHPSDFKVKSNEGVAEDWPIDYEDLEPYYSKVEREIGVSGPKYFPWEPFHGPYPLPERNPLNAVAEVFRLGCERLAIRSSPAPLAILSAPYNDRPPCTNRGFCNQGCIPNAKYSALITHARWAADAGADIRPNCMASRVIVSKGRASGVEYFHQGQEYFLKAKVVILSASVVETPRLLFNSSTAQFPDGLANNSGMVGKNLMPHSSHDVYARFNKEIRPYKGTPVMALTMDFYETDPKNGFARGFIINSHGFRPVSFVSQIAGHYLIYGEELRNLTLDYNYYSRITLIGEVLPDVKNCVTLDGNLKDQYGLPVPRISFSYGPNDLAIIDKGIEKCKDIMEAADGRVEYVVADTAHLMGTCRMGNDPQNSVVNEFCRSHDIPNLFICDTSVFVTSTPANPTLTLMAIAQRTADYIKRAAAAREI